MEYQVQEYERCDVMQEGSIEDILIGVTKPSIDRLLKMQNPGDCIALYTTYCYVRKWQHNSNVWATSEYMMKALDWGRDRFSKAKNQLLESGFIEDVKVLGDGNKITRHFVKVRYAMKATMGKFHTAEIPQGGKPADKCTVIVDEIPFNGNQIISRQQEKAILGKMRRMSESFREIVKEQEASQSRLWDNFDEPNSSQQTPTREIPESGKPERKKQVEQKPVDDEFIAKIKQIHGNIDVDRQLKKMDCWLAANPSKKKTRRFVSGWLNRCTEFKEGYLPNGDIDWSKVKPNE